MYPSHPTSRDHLSRSLPSDRTTWAGVLCTDTGRDSHPCFRRSPRVAQANGVTRTCQIFVLDCCCQDPVVVRLRKAHFPSLSPISGVSFPIPHPSTPKLPARPCRQRENQNKNMRKSESSGYNEAENVTGVSKGKQEPSEPQSMSLLEVECQKIKPRASSPFPSPPCARQHALGGYSITAPPSLHQRPLTSSPTSSSASPSSAVPSAPADSGYTPLRP